MNWDRIEADWTQFRSRVHHHWGRLTDDDLDLVGGRRAVLVGRIQHVLVGRIQQRYGYPKNARERQVAAWSDTVL